MGNLSKTIRVAGPFNRTGFTAKFTNRTTHVEVTEIEFGADDHRREWPNVKGSDLALGVLIDATPPYFGQDVKTAKGKKALATYLAEENRRLAEQIETNRLVIQICRKSSLTKSEENA